MREIISQSHAARLRGVSRQRINDLVKQNRFTVPQNAKGEVVTGALYLDEVLTLEEGKRGRPRKTQNDWFKVGDAVLWALKPRGTFGFVIPIVATVIKISNKKIQLRFIGGDSAEHLAWATRDDCLAYDTASDNRLLEELTAQAQELKMGY
jgi:hypothetical protein